MDERNNPRLATESAVACHTAQGLTWATLWNLSACGCLLEGLDAKLRSGTRMSIELLENICVSGQVVWRRDSFAGIAFASEVSDVILEQLDLTRNFGLWMGRTDLPHPLDEWGISAR